MTRYKTCINHCRSRQTCLINKVSAERSICQIFCTESSLKVSPTTDTAIATAVAEAAAETAAPTKNPTLWRPIATGLAATASATHRTPSSRYESDGGDKITLYFDTVDSFFNAFYNKILKLAIFLRVSFFKK